MFPNKIMNEQLYIGVCAVLNFGKLSLFNDFKAVRFFKYLSIFVFNNKFCYEPNALIIIK